MTRTVVDVLVADVQSLPTVLEMPDVVHFDTVMLPVHLAGIGRARGRLSPFARLGYGRAFGITLTLDTDPLQLGLDPLDGLRAVAAVVFELDLTRRSSRTVW